MQQLVRIVLLTLLLGPAAGARADSAQTSADQDSAELLQCLKTIRPLSAPYEGRLREACHTAAADFCWASAEQDACLDELVIGLTDYYRAHVSQLPATIDGTPLQQKSYDRGLSQLERAYARPHNCPDNLAPYVGKPPWTQTACDLIAVSVATDSFLRRFDQAGLQYP